MNLEFLLYFVFDNANSVLDPILKGISLSVKGLVDLESCIINPISGFLAFSDSLGITTLSL